MTNVFKIASRRYAALDIVLHFCRVLTSDGLEVVTFVAQDAEDAEQQARQWVKLQGNDHRAYRVGKSEKAELSQLVDAKHEARALYCLLHDDVLLLEPGQEPRRAATRRVATAAVDHVDQLLREATLNDQYLRGSGIEFWIYALVKCKTGEALPIKGKAVKSVPKEIVKDLSQQERYEASKAAEQGMLWYFNVEGKGWDWVEQKGDVAVPQVHAALQWLRRFKDTTSVDGCGLIYAEVGNQLRS